MSLHEKSAIFDNMEDSIFGRVDSSIELPKYKMPEYEMNPDVILELIKDELFLDGNAGQNLATFCQTWEEKQIHALMDISINKNLIDKDEYPRTAEIEKRCVNILAGLWNVGKRENSIGTSGIGSSEACMLGGMAMLKRWKKNRENRGELTDKPNLVCGPVQVVWEKFCRYWDVEIRQVPMEADRMHIDAASMLARVDENTIGVVSTFGLTFTGKYEPVKELNDALDKLYKETGLDINIHVDAASGGFIAPFCVPDLEWDFRVPRVKSISASGHKFGLAPLGVGWIIWRDTAYLPEELIFHVNYLGGDMPIFQLNFSRPAGQIISQYYLFLRLGRKGYKRIHDNCYKTAVYISQALKKIGIFEIIHGGEPQEGIPAVAWKIKDTAKVNFNLYDLADRLRIRGWQVPAYSLPDNMTDTVIQRALVRQGISYDMGTLLIEDIKKSLAELKVHVPATSMTEMESGGFKH